MERLPPTIRDHRRPIAPRPLLAARAREALAALEGDLGALLGEELARMASERRAWRAGAPHRLDLAAHDLKGLGATFGAPLLGRVAASLERLLRAGDPAPRLVEAHVDALAAMVREEAARADDARGLVLAATLERAVAAALSGRLAQAA